MAATRRLQKVNKEKPFPVRFCIHFVLNLNVFTHSFVLLLFIVILYTPVKLFSYCKACLLRDWNRIKICFNKIIRHTARYTLHNFSHILIFPLEFTVYSQVIYALTRILKNVKNCIGILKELQCHTLSQVTISFYFSI